MRFIPRKKISELEELAPVTLDTTYVVGISGSTTYKFPINQLTSSLDTTFATDLVTTALSNTLDTKLATAVFNTNSASFHNRINAVLSSVSTGTSGTSGTSGPQGNQGPIGPQGINGTAGSSGAQGEVGPQGDVGPQGEVGLTGPQGEVGPQGTSGTDGTNGAQGPQGINGTAGSSGVQGPQGNQGTQGAQGVSGEITWKASGIVNRGVDVTLGNLKARLAATGNKSLQLSTVSGTYNIYGSGTYNQSGTIAGVTLNSTLLITTTPTYVVPGYDFAVAGAVDVWNIVDVNSGIAWRITMIIGFSYLNNFISIERLH